MGNRTRKKGVKRYFFDGLEYLRESRYFIYYVFAVFMLGVFAGFFLHYKFVFLNELLKQLALDVEGLGALELIYFIFSNNTTSAFFGLIFGFFLGIFPVISALFNGVVLGYVFSLVVKADGFSSLWKILPHGIFELPAIFIAFGLGVKLGLFWLSKNRGKELSRRLINSLIIFVIIILPLLVIAAIIEGLLIFLYK